VIKVFFVDILILHRLEKLRIQSHLHLICINKVRSYAKRRRLLILLGLTVIIVGLHDYVTAYLNRPLSTCKHVLIARLIPFKNAHAQVLWECLEIRIQCQIMV